MTVNRIFVATMALGLWLCATDASAYHAIYRFQGHSDGAYPQDITGDDQGNLYGTTVFGGDKKCQCGTIYRLSPSGEETVLHRFTGDDGASPDGTLVWGPNGNLYGTTYQGGNNANACTFGCGTIYSVTPDGILTTLYKFRGKADGSGPAASLYVDALGNLFGTATNNGNPHCSCGTLFKLAPDGTFSVLHAFKGGDVEGTYPQGTLVADADGDLFGTTYSGGGGPCFSFGCGTVFELTTDGVLHTLHAFNGTDGQGPAGTIVRDAAGNIYGVAQGDGPSGKGLAFMLAPDGSESSLHVFTGGTDGSFPIAGLSADAQGNLYGAVLGGGDPTCNCGTVFTIGGSGTFDVLHTFSGRPNGATFFAGDGPLYVDKRGHIYGELTKESAGNNGPVCCGLVFALHR
jgi:uncharacterized repeat protein (TIGR03803 family)